MPGNHESPIAPQPISSPIRVQECWKWLMVAALMFYAFSLRQFYVGFYNDDAQYILAARSLLEGRFVLLQTPGEPPVRQILPGYPLFLAPFVKLVSPHWGLLKGTTVLLTLLSVSMLWSLLRDWKAPWTRLIVVALYALNPATGFYSGAVMSDTFFLVIILLALLSMRWALERENVPRTLLLGILLGWCAITRPPGILLLPCVGIGLLWERRPRIAFPALAVALLLWAAVLARNYVLSGTPTEYVSFFRGSLVYLSDPEKLARNLLDVASQLFAVAMPLPGAWAPNTPVRWMALGLGLFLTGFGFKKVADENVLGNGLLLAVGTFVLSYFLMMALWTARDPRYFLAILPFSLIFVVEGGKAAAARLPFPSLGAGLALALISVGYLAQNADALRAAWSDARPFQAIFPQDTFEWIRRHSSREAVFLGRSAAIYLYTGRQGFGGASARDREEFRYRLLNRSVRYVFLQEAAINAVRGHGPGFRDDAQIQKRIHRWVPSWPQAFRRVYSNPAEGTAIYDVVGDQRFLHSYRLLMGARWDFAAARPDQGFLKLKRAMAADPELVSAFVAYGQAVLAEGRDWHLAERPLLHALRLRPQEPVTLLTLAQMYVVAGQGELAKRYLSQAEEAAEAIGEREELSRYFEALRTRIL